MDKQFYVYIMTNFSNTVLYTGVTNNIRKRTWQHKQARGRSFTSRYNAVKLVYYEVFSDAYQAIVREKQIKGGSRRKKVALVESKNPLWQDLSDEFVRP